MTTLLRLDDYRPEPHPSLVGLVARVDDDGLVTFQPVTAEDGQTIAFPREVGE